MKFALLLAALVLVGCGHKDDAPPNPYAPYVGTWEATVTAAAGSYAPQFTVGEHFGATIDATGLVSTTDSGGVPIVYQLTQVGATFTGSRSVGSDTETLNVSFSSASAGGAVLIITSTDYASVSLVKLSSSI